MLLVSHRQGRSDGIRSNKMSTGIYIDRTEFGSWPADLQKRVLDQMFHSLGTAIQPSAGFSQESEEVAEHFAELAPGQARDLYLGCQPKTKKVIESIAHSASRKFQIADVAKSVGEAPAGLQGIWSGLTRRTRTVTGDPQAYLIDWTKSEATFDSDGNYVDQRGEVTEITYRAFRKALGLK